MLTNSAGQGVVKPPSIRRLGQSKWWIMAVLSFAYLILAMHTPVSLLGNASYDDALFIRHALSIVQGHWLGPYDNLTLAKGSGYPLFLAAGFFLGLPVTLSEAFLHIAGCLAIALALWRLTSSRGLALVSYAVLLWHPALMFPRVVRDAVYPSQVLLISAGIICLAVSARQGRFRPWLALLTGAAFGWFWLTREEGIWLVPGLLLWALLITWLQWRENSKQWPLVGGMALFIVAFALVDMAVRTMNYVEYRTFTNVDTTSRNFKDAMTALQGVRVGPVVPHVPVPLKVREAIYAASPAFAELAWYLDDKASPGYGWRDPGCKTLPSTCGDLAGGWFMWAFRDAVASRGYYHSAASADDYYRRLTDQVEAACAGGFLHCQRTWIPLMPLISKAQWQEVPDNFLAAAKTLVFLKNKPSAGVLVSTDPTFDGVNRLLGRPLETPVAHTGVDSLRLRGWYYAQGTQWFHLRCKDGPGPKVRMDRLASPDIAVHFSDKNAGYQRFDTSIDEAPGCNLQLVNGSGANEFNLKQVKRGKKVFTFGSATLYIDAWGEVGSEPLSAFESDAQRIHHGLIEAYDTMLPAISLLGWVCFLLWAALLCYRKRLRERLLCIGAALVLWTFVVSRIGVVVLVNISSFNAINQQYLLPAYPLLCGVALLSVFGLFGELHRRTPQETDNVAI